MDIKYLEEIPIDPNLLRDKDDISNSLAFRSYLNLGFNSVSAIDRLSNLHEIQRLELDYQNQASLYSLILVIESYMCTLIWTPTFTNMERSLITEHYRRRRIKVNSNKILPTEAYAREVMFSSSKTWGTPYGSLGYFIHMNEDIEEYMSPSQIIDFSIRSLISTCMDISKGKDYEGQILTVFNTLLNSMEQDEIIADTAIYRSHSNLISLVNQTRSGYKQAVFLESWGKDVLSWYLERYRETGLMEGPIPPNEDNDLIGYDVLVSISKMMLSYGLSMESFNEMSWSLVHQEIAPIYYSVMEEIINIRKGSTYQIDTISRDDIKTLMGRLYESIPINEDAKAMRLCSQTILESCAPPSGFNLWLVCLSSALLNRAYILVHGYISSYQSTDLSNLKAEELGRVYRLIYMSARLLRKSSLEHINIIGSNLQLISGLEDERISFREDILNDNY